MRLERADLAVEKGWYLGPWNSDLQISAGWATTALDMPQYHRRMTEIYLVAQGTATARVEGETVELRAGDMLALAPGEAHSFLASSEGYLHFVIHTPALPHDAAQADQIGVARDRLGL
jgi:mannose-6-phosphate isomerase-like protein (cupin superfamily)